MWLYVFRVFRATFRGSTVKGTCFTIAKDLGIISYPVITIKYVTIVGV
jgi:hypothetical protein